MINFFYGIGLLFFIACAGTFFVFLGFKIYEYHGGFATYLYVIGTVSVMVLGWRRERTR